MLTQANPASTDLALHTLTLDGLAALFATADDRARVAGPQVCQRGTEQLLGRAPTHDDHSVPAPAGRGTARVARRAGSSRVGRRDCLGPRGACPRDIGHGERRAAASAVA